MINLDELLVNKKTKEYVLSKVSNNDIILHFYNDNIIINKKIRSPFPSHEDKNPSFVFYKNNNGNITFYDFGLNVYGGAFDFVMNMFSVSFYEAIDIILIEFGLEKGSKITFNKNNKTHSKTIKVHKRASIGFKIRPFRKYDLDYWSKFGINIKTLTNFNVFPVKYIFINGKSIVAEKYAYVYIELIKNSYYIKIYQPYSIKSKWISNMPAKVLFGYTEIPKTGELLIITKAKKEIMSLYNTLKIPSIAIQTEGIVINENVLMNLKNRFKNIITLFDNDKQGLYITNKYNQLGYKSIILKESKNYSDLIEEIGIEKSKNILINKIKEIYDYKNTLL